MKNPIKKIFDDTKPLFTGDGKYHKYEPVWDATKTFFFLPSPKTTVMPFVRDCLDLKRYMSFVILALLPVTLFGIYNTGLQSGLARGEAPTILGAFLSGAWVVVP
ncbi:MAG: RnfABCDGE type electron transport complex subunit D, partial [Desulfobacterales bacterium]|nr:RnfABCDGE type electron transport complex subunit D [Desulfobacterales bacterium]